MRTVNYTSISTFPRPLLRVGEKRKTRKTNKRKPKPFPPSYCKRDLQKHDQPSLRCQSHNNRSGVTLRGRWYYKSTGILFQCCGWPRRTVKVLRTTCITVLANRLMRQDDGTGHGNFTKQSSGSFRISLIFTFMQISGSQQGRYRPSVTILLV